MNKNIVLSILLLSFISVSFADEKCTLVRIIDGDTIVCNINNWPKFLSEGISVRMRDCDSPEVKTKDIREKKLGLFAKEQLIEKKLAGSHSITLKNIGKGKYFRLVADIYADDRKLTCFEEKYVYSAPSYKCGTKKSRCYEMSDCDEALYYLQVCGVTSLDRDKDGIPCESMCN